MMDKAFLLYPTVNKTHSKKRYKAIKDIAKEFKVEPQRELKAIDGSGKRDMPNHEYLFIEACAVLLYFFKPETDRRQKLDLVHNMEEFLTEFPDFKHASIDDEELQKLYKFRNFMQIASQMVITPKMNMEHLLDLCTILAEGKGVKYVTGGGEKASTTRRKNIYRKITKVSPLPGHGGPQIPDGIIDSILDNLHNNTNVNEGFFDVLSLPDGCGFEESDITATRNAELTDESGSIFKMTTVEARKYEDDSALKTVAVTRDNMRVAAATSGTFESELTFDEDFMNSLFLDESDLVVFLERLPSYDFEATRQVTFAQSGPTVDSFTVSSVSNAMVDREIIVEHLEPPSDKSDNLMHRSMSRYSRSSYAPTRISRENSHSSGSNATESLESTIDSLLSKRCISEASETKSVPERSSSRPRIDGSF